MLGIEALHRPSMRTLRRVPFAAGVFAATTGSVWAAETALGIDDASPLYLIAVVAGASLLGTGGGLAVAVAAFAVYDLLFTEPRFSLVIANPLEWLDLLLFLFVGVVVGRLVGLAREREEAARAHAREAEAVARVSRALATRPLGDALPEVTRELAAQLGLERVWIELAESGDVVGDTGGVGPRPQGGRVGTLDRASDARWIQARTAHPAGSHETASSGTVLRVRIERDGRVVGAIWATSRAADAGDAATARLLGLVADVVGLAFERERLAAAEVDAEVARRADALKSRLVTSVSHDLRTPLSGIRAAAGTILDPAVPLDAEAARAAAETIEAESVRLDRMIRGLLDLGRIESGSLRANVEPFDLAALVAGSLERLRDVIGGRPLTVAVPPDLPPVLVDDLLFDHVLANLLENVARHAPAPAPLRLTASDEDGAVRLVVEDGGPGVPSPRVARLFGRSEQAPRADGRGVGLTVVEALADAMAIEVTAGPSTLGGLAVELRIPTVARPPDEAAA